MIFTRTPLPLLISAVVLLSGCQFVPKYFKPDAPIPENYPTATKAGAKSAADIGWRDFFQNPELQAVIQSALENNRDLKTAALRIEEARALFNIQRADELPTLNATGNATRARQFVLGTMRSSTTYQVGASLSSFELDFFGRVKNLSNAALAQYLATEEARRAVQISLVGEVAKAWLNERALAEQSLLASRTLQARETSFDLVKKRFDAGITNALELRQSDTLVQSARAALLAARRQHAQASNALALLVGAAGKLPDASATLSAQNIVADIAAGLPSDLIAHRPDIRSAEQKLRANQANIAAARAAFFPRISLTSGVGLASDNLSDLFAGSARTWSFAPQLILPIFDAGRNKANLSLAQVRTNIAVADYEKTIQIAFREVADALAARATIDEEVTAQQAVQTSQTDRLKLAQARYQNGIANYLEVLDAERELFAAEQQLLQTRLLRLTNAVDLYRSLGGGLNDSAK
ncbi:MAG: efflux transporter outer membrane subunit [Burkholderiaceae bacterium]